MKSMLKRLLPPLLILFGLVTGLVIYVQDKDRRHNLQYYFIKNNIINLNISRVDHKLKEGIYFVVGEVSSRYPVEDPLFLAPLNFLAIQRKVETYQWQEISVSGSEKKNYQLIWSEETIDSRGFVVQGEYLNPTPLLKSAEFYNRESYVENYSAKEVIKWGSTLNYKPLLLANFSEKLKIKDSQLAQEFRSLHRRIDGVHLYFEKVPGLSSVGDVRISWQVLEPGIFSIISSKHLDVLVKIPMPDNSYLGIFKKGHHTMEELLLPIKVKKNLWELLLH
jgi:hypothetical protein